MARSSEHSNNASVTNTYDNAASPSGTATSQFASSRERTRTTRPSAFLPQQSSYSASGRVGISNLPSGRSGPNSGNSSLKNTTLTSNPGWTFNPYQFLNGSPSSTNSNSSARLPFSVPINRTHPSSNRSSIYTNDTITSILLEGMRWPANASRQLLDEFENYVRMHNITVTLPQCKQFCFERYVPSSSQGLTVGANGQTVYLPGCLASNPDLCEQQVSQYLRQYASTSTVGGGPKAMQVKTAMRGLVPIVTPASGLRMAGFQYNFAAQTDSTVQNTVLQSPASTNIGAFEGADVSSTASGDKIHDRLDIPGSVGVANGVITVSIGVQTSMAHPTPANAPFLLQLGSQTIPIVPVHLPSGSSQNGGSGSQGSEHPAGAVKGNTGTSVGAVAPPDSSQNGNTGSGGSESPPAVKGNTGMPIESIALPESSQNGNTGTTMGSVVPPDSSQNGNTGSEAQGSPPASVKGNTGTISGSLAPPDSLQNGNTGSEGSGHPAGAPEGSTMMTGGPAVPFDSSKNGNSGSSPLSSPAYLIQGHTLIPGGPAVSLSGTQVALLSVPNTAVIGGSSAPVQEVTRTGAPLLQVGAEAIKPNSNGDYVVNSQTITPGGPAVAVSGTPVSLIQVTPSAVIGGRSQPLPLPEATPAPVLTLASQTYTPSGGTVRIGSQTLVAGGHAVTISGTPVSLALPSSVAAIGGQSFTLPAQITTQVAVLTVNSQTYTPNSAQVYTIAGQKLIPGGSPIKVTGTPVSLDTAGSVAVIGTSSEIITSSLVVKPIEVAGHKITPTGVGSYIVGGQTILPGAAPITISGTPISIASHGLEAVIGSSTETLRPAPLTFEGQTLTPDNHGVYVVEGKTLIPGGSPIIVHGTSISLESGDARAVIGSSTQTLRRDTTTEGLLTIDHQTVTADSSGAFTVDGQTLSPNKPAITISGTPLSLISHGLAAVIGGSSTQYLNRGTVTTQPRNPVVTLAGHTYTANSQGVYVINGQSITVGQSQLVTLTIPPSGLTTLPSSNPIIKGSSNGIPILSIAAETITPGPSGFTIPTGTGTAAGEATVLPGGPQITVSGTKLSLGTNGMLIVNNATIFVPPSMSTMSNGNNNANVTAGESGGTVTGSLLTDTGSPVTTGPFASMTSIGPPTGGPAPSASRHHGNAGTRTIRTPSRTGLFLSMLLMVLSALMSAMHIPSRIRAPLLL